MFNIGTPELLVILLIALIVVGPRRLPELGRTLGRGLREFRKVQDDVRDMVKFDLTDDDPPGAGPRRKVPTEPVKRPSPADDQAEDAPDEAAGSAADGPRSDSAGDGAAEAPSAG